MAAPCEGFPGRPVGLLLLAIVSSERHAILVEESLIIVGCVALWHPLGVFLYDWWPIRAEAKLFDRLGESDVKAFNACGTAPRVAERSVA